MEPTTHGRPTIRTASPSWAEWRPSQPYTVGIEEEVMLIDPLDFSLAQRIDDVLPRLSPQLASHVTAETHRSAIELASSPHETAGRAADEAAELRAALASELADLGLRAASAGVHPFAIWTETRISSGARYQLIHGSMRALARREPTFALHVHIGVDDPEAAIELHNRLRTHAPLLLALSANSPFWQGRDTGLASARTPLFQAFPRVGIPRAFPSYEEYVETVDQLLRCNAFPEPTFLWWDVRPQPRFGTVEVRIMDAQTTVTEIGALAALVQATARLELEEGYVPQQLISAAELLDENRFLALRDGIDARLLDPVSERRVPVRQLVHQLIEAARPHAADLGCEQQLDALNYLIDETGAARQRRIARERKQLWRVVESLADAFAPDR
jgi:glutamate---cysteine ligase / carboxylate-amine ligase